MTGVRLPGLRLPARFRLTVARHHGHLAAHDDFHVERLPPAAFFVLRVVAPEPTPLLEPEVRVAIHVEEDVGGITAPDRFQGLPIVRSVGAQVAVVRREDLRTVGLRAAVELHDVWHWRSPVATEMSGL